MPNPVSIMDNCCGCGTPPGPPTASMRARFQWPGFPAFNDPGDVSSVVGVRYLNLTVSGYWDNEVGTIIPFSYTIRSDQLNSSFLNDPVTGAGPPDYNHFWNLNAPGIDLSLQGAVITPTSYTLSQPGFPDLSIVLSGPIPLSFCKAAAHNLLLLSGGVDSLTRGHYKIATWSDQPNDRLSNGVGTGVRWVSIGVQSMENNPNYPPVQGPAGPTPQSILCWVNAEGLPTVITARLHTNPDGSPSDYFEPWPFASNPRQVVIIDDSPGDPGSAIEDFEQTDFWEVIEYKYFDVSDSYCVTQSFQDLDAGVPFAPPICSIQPPNGVEQSTGSPTLRLDPPDLVADVSKNFLITLASGIQSQILTSGGCPCIPPPLHE